MRKVRCVRSRPGMISALNVTCISGRAQVNCFSSELTVFFFLEKKGILFFSVYLLFVFYLAFCRMSALFNFLFSESLRGRSNSLAYGIEYRLFTLLFLRSRHRPRLYGPEHDIDKRDQKTTLCFRCFYIVNIRYSRPQPS